MYESWKNIFFQRFDGNFCFVSWILFFLSSVGIYCLIYPIFIINKIAGFFLRVKFSGWNIIIIVIIRLYYVFLSKRYNIGIVVERDLKFLKNRLSFSLGNFVIASVWHLLEIPIADAVSIRGHLHFIVARFEVKCNSACNHVYSIYSLRDLYRVIFVSCFIK